MSLTEFKMRSLADKLDGQETTQPEAKKAKKTKKVGITKKTKASKKK